MFLDLEASSLGPRSWPIEIGCAWIARGQVHSRATLIRPREDWSLDGWTESAEQVHGIPYDALAEGECPDWVAAKTDALADFTVVSDNPMHDQAWLDRLRGDRFPIRVQSLRLAAATELDSREADMFSINLLRAPTEHRAGADAERLARAWLGASAAQGLAA